ncbi:MAG: NAD(P)H-dependent oxidoreductase [Marinifilaceae bacterium]|jgi:putative NADPH-quinone reductase|nr:NAD(P)H-dependent oxidoreductase [Marinifilaceae bacterium]
MKTVLILAHPELNNSVANKRIAEQLKSKREDIEVRDIMALYPDYKIDIETEQQALIEADTVIFQYPFWWYNMPGILKQWFDYVFNFNFAFGPEGNKLKGKNFLLSFTVGGPNESYSPLGYNHFRIEDFVKPMEQTAYLAQMNFLDPIYEHGMVFIPGVYNTKEGVEAKADNVVERIIEQLERLENQNPEEIIKTFAKEWFEHFDILAEDGYFNSYISNDAKLSFVEGDFIGHDGFSKWYSEIKKIIKPNNEHRIESISISENNDKYNVELSVKLKAEKIEGGILELNVKENWEIELTSDNRVKIHEYIVKPV